MKSFLDDDGQESTEAVEDGNDTNLDESVDPALPVFYRLFDLLLPVVSGSTAVSLHLLGTPSHESFFFRVQKICGFVASRYRKYTACCPSKSDGSLDDVKPMTIVLIQLTI